MSDHSNTRILYREGKRASERERAPTSWEGGRGEGDAASLFKITFNFYLFMECTHRCRSRGFGTGEGKGKGRERMLSRFLPSTEPADLRTLASLSHNPESDP